MQPGSPAAGGIRDDEVVDSSALGGAATLTFKRIKLLIYSLIFFYDPDFIPTIIIFEFLEVRSIGDLMEAVDTGNNMAYLFRFS